MSRPYDVTWQTQVWADSLEGAARIALEVQSDKDRTASSTFHVEDTTGRMAIVDLADDTIRTRCTSCQDRLGKDGLGRTCKPCKGGGWITTYLK